MVSTIGYVPVAMSDVIQVNIPGMQRTCFPQSTCAKRKLSSKLVLMTFAYFSKEYFMPYTQRGIILRDSLQKLSTQQGQYIFEVGAECL